VPLLLFAASLLSFALLRSGGLLLTINAPSNNPIDSSKDFG